MTGRSTLPVVAATGDRLATLESLRQRLAQEIEGTESARDVAALAKQLRDTLAEIAVLAVGCAQTQEDATFDELASRRTDRGADTEPGQRAAGREPR